MPRPMTGWRGYGAAWVTSTRPGWLSPARGRKATVAALLIAATAWPVWQFSRDAHPGADYASGNALRVVELPDGSSVTLDAESAIALDYAAGKRVVRLLAGRALFEAACRARWPRLHRHHARCISHGAGHALYRGAPGAWHPRRGLRTPRASALPDLRRRSRRHPGQRRQRPGLGRRHRPRRLVKRSGAGLEPRPALVQRCGAAGGGGAIVPLHQQARAGAGRPRAMRASPAPRAWPTRNARWNCCSRRPACGSPTCRDCCCCVDRDDRHAAAHLPFANR